MQKKKRRRPAVEQTGGFSLVMAHDTQLSPGQWTSVPPHGWPILYRVELPERPDDATFAAMMAWCAENGIAPWSPVRLPCQLFTFTDLNHAIYFKLRWYDA